MRNINIYAVSGSLRTDSTNTGLLRFARDNAPEGMHIELAELGDVPFYNQDIKTPPESVQELLKGFKKADAFLFAAAEYNYSLAPALKNALDWASRSDDKSLLNGKAAAILGSGGGMGTSRAQYHLRQVLTYLDVHPLNKPEVFCHAFGGSFDSRGNLLDEAAGSLIIEQLTALRAWSEKIRG